MHFTPQPPQLSGSLVVRVHTPAQLLSPAAQAHMPPVQLWPDEQVIAQPPQLPELDLVSTQAPPQLVRPGPQAAWQAPPEQTWPAAQLVPQAPQLRGSLARTTHCAGEPQATVPAAQPQVPLPHTMPPVQEAPQAPQLLSSDFVSTQDPAVREPSAATRRCRPPGYRSGWLRRSCCSCRSYPDRSGGRRTRPRTGSGPPDTGTGRRHSLRLRCSAGRSPQLPSSDVWSTHEPLHEIRPAPQPAWQPPD